jgi:hypothetical protein
MIHHTFHPLPFVPFAHLDQWSPPWPDVYAFSKSDSRLSRPHPYSSRRRPPYPRLEPTSASSPRPPRTGAPQVLRTQVPPTLSALPIPMSTPVLECEFWFSISLLCTVLMRPVSIAHVHLVQPRIADVDACSADTYAGVSPSGVQRAIIGTQAASISTTGIP